MQDISIFICVTNILLNSTPVSIVCSENNKALIMSTGLGFSRYTQSLQFQTVSMLIAKKQNNQKLIAVR